MFPTKIDLKSKSYHECGDYHATLYISLRST